MSLVLILLFIILVPAAFAGYKGAPFVPTRKKDLQQALTFLEKKPFHSVIDLGCGTGSFLFALAQKHPHATLCGYDVSLAPLLYGWIRKSLSPNLYRNVHLYAKNLYNVNVSSADVIFVFMMQRPHTHIAKAVLRNTKADALVLFEGWPPEGFLHTTLLQEKECLPLYIYKGSAFHA